MWVLVMHKGKFETKHVTDYAKFYVEQKNQT